MKRSLLRGSVAIIVVTAMSVLSLYNLGLLNISTLMSASKNLMIFFAELFPPRWEIMPTLIEAIWETIQISFTGTIVGFILSLPLAFLGTHYLFNRYINIAVRMVIGAMRAIPSILYGIIFVVAFGLGPQAGTLGVAFYTVGYLAKLYYESFEAVDTEVIEAIRSTGCNRMQLFRFAILPEAANTIVSQLLFMFEYNIRASTIMGFVGAGGIGYYMVGYVQMLQYRHLMTTIILTFLVIMIIDYLSLKIRERIAVPGK